MVFRHVCSFFPSSFYSSPTQALSRASIFHPPALPFGTSVVTAFRHFCSLCFSSFYSALRSNQAAGSSYPRSPQANITSRRNWYRKCICGEHHFQEIFSKSHHSPGPNRLKQVSDEDDLGVKRRSIPSNPTRKTKQISYHNACLVMVVGGDGEAILQ